MFAKLFYGRTVASITASLSSMVKDLEAHAEAKQGEAESHNAAINEIQTLYAIAAQEVDKARAVAVKIVALFS